MRHHYTHHRLLVKEIQYLRLRHHLSRDNNTSSLIKSSISYRVLLPNDLFRIGLGDTIVLVVDKELFGFKKSISDYLVKYDIDLHSRVQNGVIKFEFLMRVTAFHIRDEY